ncbi:hypothetical protein ALC62_03138, partial [Cyphomyrmex costatus]
IISAKRLNIRTLKDGEVTYSPSRTVLIKFRGQFLPRSVYFMHVSFPISPYIPRVLMCFCCLRYGHVSANCKGKSRCERCGNNKHLVPDDCPRIQLPPLCCNCGGEHLPSASNCPAFLKQKLIYTTAAIENISYVEARSKLGGPPPSSSSPPNSFHPSVFPSLPHTHIPLRRLVNYHDLVTENPLSLHSRPDMSKSYASVSSSTAPSNGRSFSSPPLDPLIQASTSAPRNFFKPSHNFKNKSSAPHAVIDNMPLRDIHNSFLYAPNGRMPSASSFPSPSFSPPAHDLPSPSLEHTSYSLPNNFPSAKHPTETNSGGLSYVIQSIISFLQKILSYIPSGLLTSLFGPDFQRIIDFLLTFSNNDTRSSLG